MKSILFLSCFAIFIISCVSKRLNKNGAPLSFKVYRIDSINNYYLIYAKKNDTLYKIVSSKVFQKINGSKVEINKLYNFDLVSLWNQETIINGVNVAPATTFNVTCLGFDDSTSICIEKDSINDLHIAKNLKGLYVVPTLHSVH